MGLCLVLVPHTRAYLNTFFMSLWIWSHSDCVREVWVTGEAKGN